MARPWDLIFQNDSLSPAKKEGKVTCQTPVPHLGFRGGSRERRKASLDGLPLQPASGRVGIKETALKRKWKNEVPRGWSKLPRIWPQAMPWAPGRQGFQKHYCARRGACPPISSPSFLLSKRIFPTDTCWWRIRIPCPNFPSSSLWPCGQVLASGMAEKSHVAFQDKSLGKDHTFLPPSSCSFPSCCLGGSHIRLAEDQHWEWRWDDSGSLKSLYHSLEMIITGFIFTQSSLWLKVLYLEFLLIAVSPTE